MMKRGMLGATLRNRCGKALRQGGRRPEMETRKRYEKLEEKRRKMAGTYLYIKYGPVWCCLFEGKYVSTSKAGAFGDEER